MTLSAIRTFVLPRSANDTITRRTFLTTRAVFDLRLRRTTDYATIDRIMAMYAPISLLVLVVVWLVLVMLGYTSIYWAIGVEPLEAAFTLSGSSLLTLGIKPPEGLPATILTFSEATIGLILVALLISYLPTIYTAFSRREQAVTLLEVRAGTPPSAVTLLQRYHRIHGLDRLHDLWATWEIWFSDLEESHTSLAALNFFRSPQPDHSWVTAAGTVLDAAALVRSTVDIPTDAQADLCLRAGYLALRRITDFFRIEYNAAPNKDDPISITQAEFDTAYDELATAGIPLKPDREQAWRDFAGWRVNYDTVLLILARLTLAPPAPWSSDRAPQTLVLR